MKIPDRPRCCELNIKHPDNTPATVYLDGKASGLKQVRRPAVQANVCTLVDLESDTCIIFLLYCLKFREEVIICFPYQIKWPWYKNDNTFFRYFNFILFLQVLFQRGNVLPSTARIFQRQYDFRHWSIYGCPSCQLS